ncbi:hypothetical protein ACFLYF_04390 [Chloroflexota bacterium]
MAKKHPSGFVPIPFKLLGKILFPISAVMVIIGGLDYLAGWGGIPQTVFFVGIGFLVLSLYLRYVVPKE